MNSHKVKCNKTEFQITEGEWIRIERKILTSGIEQGVSINLIDTDLGVTKQLGVYYHGKWGFPNPINESLLFTLFKKFPRIGREFKNIAQCHANVTTDFQMTWLCFKRRFSLNVKKVQHKLHV